MKILVVRTLQSDLVLRLLDKWKGEFPDAEFSILTHGGQVNLDYFQDKFSNVFVYDAPYDFSLFHIKPSVVQDIRKQEFDLVIVAKHMDRIEGFENVLLMLTALGGEQWVHCGIDGVLHPIEKKRVIRVITTGLIALGPALGLYAGVLATLVISEIRKIREIA